jgi:hypothetical protein
MYVRSYLQGSENGRVVTIGGTSAKNVTIYAKETDKSTKYYINGINYNLIKDEVLLTVGCTIFPMYLFIAKYLFTGSFIAGS